MSKPGPKLRLLAIVVVLTLGCFLARSLWIGPLLCSLAPAIASTFDIELEIDQASGNGTSRLELSGIRMRDLGRAGPLRRLKATTLMLEYDLVDLIRGDLAALHRIQAADFDAELDLREQSIDSDENSPSSPPRSAAAWSFPELDFENGDLVLWFAEQSRFKLNHADLHATSNGKSIELTSPEFAVLNGKQAPVVAGLTSHFGLDANGIQIQLLQWEDRLTLRDSSLDWGSSDTVTLAFELELEALGGKAKLAGQLDDSSALQFKLSASRLDLSELQPYWSASNSARGHIESLSAELRWPLDSPEQAQGHLQTRAHDLSYGGSQDMRLEAQINVGNGFLSSPRIELQSPQNRLTLTEVKLPLDLEHPLEQLRRGRLDLELEASDLPALLGRPPSDDVPHQLQIALTLEEGVAQLSRGQFTSEGGVMTVKSGTIRSSQTTAPEVELDLYAKFADLGFLGQLAGTSPWSGALAGQVKVSGTWPDIVASAELEGEQTQIAGIDLGQTKLQLTLNREHLVISELLSNNGNNQLSLSGAIALVDSRPSFEDLRLKLDISELDRLLPNHATSGQLHITAQATGTVGSLTGQWSLHGEALRVEQRAIEQFEARGLLAGDRVQIDALDLQSADLHGFLAGDLQVDPAWNVRSVALRQLELSRADQKLALQEPAKLSFANSWPTSASVRLAGTVGSVEFYSLIDASSSGPEPDEALLPHRFGFKAQKFAPMALFGPLLGDGYALEAADGSIQVTRIGKRVSFESKLQLDQLDLPFSQLTEKEFRYPWNINWDVDLSDDVLNIAAFDATSGDASQLTLSGTLPFQPLAEIPLGHGPLNVQAQVKLPELDVFRALIPGDGLWPSGSLELALDLSGNWQQPTGSLAVKALALKLEADGQTLFEQARVSGTVSLDSKTALDQVEINIPGALNFRANGSLDQAIDLFALADGHSPFLPGTPIQLQIELELEDSDWLNQLNQKFETGGWLHRFGGGIRSHFDLAGTIVHPIPSGELEIQNGEFKLSPNMPAIEGLAGTLRVDDRRLSFEEFKGELGGESLLVAGYLDFDEQNPAIDLSLTGSNLLLYRASGIKIRSDVDLSVQGPPAQARVEGGLCLTDSRFVKRFDFLNLGRGKGGQKATRALPLFSFRDAPLADMVFDLAVTSKSPFRVDNNVVKARLRPDLRLTGSGELPALEGVLYVDGGKVLLPANDLFLRPGTIRFERSAPMIPKLELLLQNRTRGYDVTMTVTGDYDDPTVTTSSSPPLSPEDLTALVWAGQDPGEGLTSKTGRAGAQAVGLFIAQDLITRLFGDDSTESEESFLDRFQLYLGRDTTQYGAETIEMTFEVTKDLFGNSDILYLATERDIYSRVNFGLRFVFHFN